jgi:D,D-heptose 1,7-bisphosphate phosphatase
MRAVIVAGGKGTRLSSISPDMPKPMAPVGGIPLLEHQLILLKNYGFLDITIITGYGAAVIEDYFQSGERWGINLSYHREQFPLGTTGGIKEIEKLLIEDFMVLYGDVMVNMNLRRLAEFHWTKKSACTLVLHPNDHPFDSDLVEVDSEHKIIAFHPKPHEPDKYYRNLVNAGVYIISPAMLRYIKKGVPEDFGRDIFPKVVNKAPLFGYITTEYLKDIGTPERFEMVNRDYRSGKIAKLNIDRRRTAIFIDRDGVINKEIGLLCKIDDFELMPDASKAVKKINNSDFLAVVVTNQSVIARNLCSISELDEIHKKMETLLGNERAKLDALYYCPHHPDKGYPEENAEYKIDCACRKPKTGLIDRAVKEHNIDVRTSFIIGDSCRDLACGKNAGLITVGLRTGHGCRDGDISPDYFFETFNEAVSFIIDAPYDELFKEISRCFFRPSGKKPFIIAIGGNTRSGKTVLSQYLSGRFSGLGCTALQVALDNWLLAKEQRRPGQSIYDRFQLEKIAADVEKIIHGEAVVLQKYNQLSCGKSDRLIDYQLAQQDIIIIDGIVALSSAAVRRLADLKIFCDIGEELLVRRLKNFYRWKGCDEAAIENLLNCRRRDEYSIIHNNSRFADLVVQAKEI